MRLLWCIVIEERHTTLCSSFRISNRPLAIFLACLQLTVALASFLQHILSIYLHKHIFLCRSNIGANEPWQVKVLAHDIIIFDFGLMRRVLGTEECVANYLDGGYMRFAWTIEHASSLSLAILAMSCFPKPLWLLWPGLLMQSSYSLGMSVLSMATAPKILEALGGHVDFRLSMQFTIYLSGFCMNWLFTFILWHHYWHMEKVYGPQRDRQTTNSRPVSGNIAHL